MQFKNTPENIMQIIELFHNQGLKYNLFKCEHIFAGNNENLDILFATKEDYNKASSLLKENGFIIYMSEKVEKYKKMYLKLNNGTLTKIHLHREIAWNGVKVLDENNIFARQVELNKMIYFPSPEDSILIHIAHILFENFTIGPKEVKYIAACLIEKNNKKGSEINYRYINKQLNQFGWKKEFYYLFNKFNKNKVEVGKKVSFTMIIKSYFKAILKQPLIIPHLTKRVIKLIGNRISLKRKGTLIALIGVNGSGKTTTTELLKEELKLLATFFHVPIEGYYFGWRPFSPIAKLLSRIMKKKKTFKKIAEQEGITKKEEKENEKKGKKLSMFQEGLFLYNFMEYLLRYWIQIYPKLRKREIIITDRYFYDIYGQYPYAEKSILIKNLMKLFPKPDKTFILDADIETIMKRGKTNKEYETTKTKLKEERKIKSKNYLEGQRKRYKEINKIIKSIIITTEEDKIETTRKITNKIWKLSVKKSL